MSAAGNMEKFSDIGKEIIFDCGTEDPFYKWNKVFYENCLENNIPAAFISRPGKHDWDYWEKSIRYHFEFFYSLLQDR
jgi:S-formylglutathione hydrolase FrmB